MSFRNKETIDISFDEDDELSSRAFLGKRTHISDLYDEMAQTSQKLPNSVQEFLLQSDQIQEDIKKFSQISPEKNQLYKGINEKLKQLGYQFEIGIHPSEDNILEILDEILIDFLFTSNKLEENERILEDIKDLKKSEDREQRNKTLYKNFQYSSIDSNLEDLFKEIMNRSFNMKYDEDHNIMSFIKYAEMQREKLLNKVHEYNTEKEKIHQQLKELEQKNNQLLAKLKTSLPSLENTEKLKIIDQVLVELSIKSIKELPDAINKFQKVMFALPNVEKFIADISEEFADDQDVKKLDDIIISIKAQKKIMKESEEFRKRVCQAFGSEKLKDIISYGRGLSHFCKLFEVPSSEKLLSVVEELFYFVHQIKGFISVRIT